MIKLLTLPSPPHGISKGDACYPLNLFACQSKNGTQEGEGQG